MNNRLKLPQVLALNGDSACGPTCATCKHWHQAAIDPHNVTAPRPGECWERLHSFPVLVPGHAGPKLAATITYRPIVAAEFSCGQHAPRDAT